MGTGKLQLNRSLVIACTGIMLVSVGVQCQRRNSPSRSRAQRFANDLSMTVYADIDPFAVVTRNKKRPAEDYGFFSFPSLIGMHDQKSSVLRVPGEREVTMMIGEEFSISCRYVPAQKGNLLEFWFSTSEHALLDLNADGQWDERMALKTKTVDIRLDGRWETVASDAGSRYRRKLVRNHKFVTFDCARGKWMLETSGAHGSVGSESKSDDSRL